MIYENETLITINGINALTDLEKAAEDEEPFIFAPILKMTSAFLMVIAFMAF